MKKSRILFGGIVWVVAALLTSSAWAESVEQRQTESGYTNKDVHGNDPNNYYKHPGRGSFTGPFDYGTGGEVSPVAEPQGPMGRCNCFTFDGTKSYSGNGQRLTYAWEFGDGQTSDQTVVKHCYDKAGDYNVSLTVTDESGKICGNGTAVTKVTSNFPPTANAGPEVKACIGETASFDASSSTASGSPSYKWDFGDGETGEGVKATHAYQKPGNYRVHLTVDDGKKTECSLASASTSASIADRVEVKLSTDGKDSACVNKNLRFNANGSGGAKYHWDFGDGSVWDGGSSASHSYAKGGTYTVTVSADNGRGTSCSTAVDKTTVKVFEAPMADAGENLACCVGKDVAFDGSKSTGSGLSYHWDFGDGASADGVKVNHAYTKGGNYRVVLTVDDGSKSECSASSSSFMADVNTKPEAVIEVR